MKKCSSVELYGRGTNTLLAAWNAYARGATGARVQHYPGVDVAIFPHEPERAVYNNAILQRDLPAAALAIALDSMEEAYAAAGIVQFAAWVREGDSAARGDLEQRGYRFSESTRAMGMTLDAFDPPRLEVELSSTDWPGYLRLSGLPPEFLQDADHAAFHVVVARLGGEDAAAALAFDHDGDCGIYNVETLAHARRQGLATALTALQMRDARARGCRTASLQATPMAERIYADLGFRDLGQILEYVPLRQ